MLSQVNLEMRRCFFQTPPTTDLNIESFVLPTLHPGNQQKSSVSMPSEDYSEELCLIASKLIAQT